MECYFRTLINWERNGHKLLNDSWLFIAKMVQVSMSKIGDGYGKWSCNVPQCQLLAAPFDSARIAGQGEKRIGGEWKMNWSNIAI